MHRFIVCNFHTLYTWRNRTNKEMYRLVSTGDIYIQYHNVTSIVAEKENKRKKKNRKNKTRSTVKPFTRSDLLPGAQANSTKPLIPKHRF